jgi:hypothetical protein
MENYTISMNNKKLEMIIIIFNKNNFPYITYTKIILENFLFTDNNY